MKYARVVALAALAGFALAFLTSCTVRRPGSFICVGCQQCPLPKR